MHDSLRVGTLTSPLHLYIYKVEKYSFIHQWPATYACINLRCITVVPEMWMDAFPCSLYWAYALK